ncbi:MAG: transporter substrate-binding domain-containing protein [Lentilitoribacter sp.]|uniref:transporter substrate-binding domain-containing protein n=1 Tax=Hyphomonas sp. TaxID=87 RepID=UPI0032848489
MKFAYLIEPPFNFLDENGRVTGCDVELARHVFNALDITHFNPVETEFAELLPGLNDHRWRMTTGLFATTERMQTALFSRSIWALSDGLLVKANNPHKIDGYKSIAENPNVRLAVIRDQFQHRSAIDFGISPAQIFIYETYSEAAKAVKNGIVDAYASVGKAHRGFMAQNPDWDVAEVAVPIAEKPPAYGCFAFHLNDTELRDNVNTFLNGFLGSKKHRDMVAAFGVSDADVDLLIRYKNSDQSI